MTTEVLVSKELHERIEATETAIVEFDKVAAGIAELEAAHPKDVVCDVRTAAGMKQAIAARAAWRGPRIEVEKVRKAAKAPVLALGREIDAYAKGLEARLLDGESHYDRQIKAEEARKEAEREARLEAERQRVAGIRKRIEAMRSAPVRAAGKPLAVVRALGREVFDTAIDDSFAEFAEEAQQVQTEVLDTMNSMIEAAEAQAEEAERLAREREELERQRAEQERIRAEQEEAARREREEADRIAREEREAEAARLAELRAQQEEEMRQLREAEEARLAAEREELARQQAELDRQRQEQEARERAKREADARAEAERIAAEARRRDRLQQAAQELLIGCRSALLYIENPGDEADRASVIEVLRGVIALADPEEATSE